MNLTDTCLAVVPSRYQFLQDNPIQGQNTGFGNVQTGSKHRQNQTPKSMAILNMSINNCQGSWYKSTVSPSSPWNQGSKPLAQMPPAPKKLGEFNQWDLSFSKTVKRGAKWVANHQKLTPKKLDISGETWLEMSWQNDCFGPSSRAVPCQRQNSLMPGGVRIGNNVGVV